jgi:hypothetical protein
LAGGRYNAFQNSAGSTVTSREAVGVRDENDYIARLIPPRTGGISGSTDT